MATSKLKNIKALQEMIGGTHRTQTRKTFGFNAEDKSQIRKVGEIWSEKTAQGNEIWWEQKDGYRIKHHFHPEVSSQMDKIREYLYTFPNCPKEICTCNRPTRLDQRFKKIMGMCHDCVVSMETKYKIEGKFDQYAIEKMKANAQAFFNEADKEVELLKDSFKHISFVSGVEGTEEKWTMENVEDFIQNIDEQYKNFKTQLLEKYSQQSV